MTREDHEKARFAETLIESEPFKAIVRDLKNRTIRDWADATAINRREELWHELQAIGRLESHLAGLRDGLKLEEMNAAAERKRGALADQVRNNVK